MRRSNTLLLVAVLAMAFVSACNAAPNDAAIATDIKAKMFSDPQLKDSNLQVTVTKGQVTLVGSVPSDGARLAAYKLANEEKGVGKVNDQMTVELAQATPAPPAEPARHHAPTPGSCAQEAHSEASGSRYRGKCRARSCFGARTSSATGSNSGAHARSRPSCAGPSTASSATASAESR